MRQYKEMLEYILANGDYMPTRAILESTGKNVHAISVLGYQNDYDLSDGFPILTTKKIGFKTLAHELIWFLKGDTNVKYLHDNNVHIWDAWRKPDGTIGDGYGKQWRHWVYYDSKTIKNLEKDAFFPEFNLMIYKEFDQISNLIKDIKTVIDNPFASCGRRLLLSAWNPPEIEKMALPPCHTLSQFFVRNGKLSCKLYQRSADAFLGVPFNISSYALLTSILAHLTGLKPGKFYHTFGDLHIYENHLEQVKEQLSREEYLLPRLEISPDLTDINDININHFKLIDYKSHPALKGEVAV